MPPSTPQAEDYNFIVNPAAPPPKPSPLAGSSLMMRIIIFGGGLLVLLILFSIVRSAFFSGNSDIDMFVSVAQDQQQLIHIAASGAKQRGLSTVNMNSALTTRAAITSDQTATLTYLQKNGKKIKPKVLTETISSGADSQLAAAVEAGTYDQTYKTVMEQQLTAYATRLQQTYRKTSGTNGRALLSSDYKSAQLLLQQLQAK